MRLLLDTHALIWWCADDERLGREARVAIADMASEVFVSAVSALEIATKFRLGKLPGARVLAEGFVMEVAAEGFQPLSISAAHGQLAGGLALPNKDPFDRLLIAQSLLETLTLVTNEETFDAYGVARLW